VGPYSQAVVAGGFVFASGQVPLDPVTGRLVEGDASAQAERVLANLGAVLEAAGSSLAQVVRASVYLADIADFARVNEVYARHFARAPQPARTTIEAGRLPLGAAVEIDVIALAPARPSRRVRERTPARAEARGGAQAETARAKTARAAGSRPRGRSGPRTRGRGGSGSRR
jgi:2-iminobutanoate/2-iminopropanoate deaminase